jgi:tetratricopeptide (TPR) repeat protein
MSALKKYKKFKTELTSLGYCLIAIVFLLLAGGNINKYLTDQTTPKVKGAQIDATEMLNEKAYWEKIVKDNPTYRDGYLQLALINDQLGNKEESVNNFNKAKLIDPNSQKVADIQKLLNIQN